MSKELELLKTLKDMIIGNGVNDNINDYVDNLILPIKQALQRLEAIDNANPSEALECLEKIDDRFYLIKYRTTDGGNKEEYEFCPSDTKEYDVIENFLLKAQKEHKALEIIKEKNVDIKLLKLSTNLLDYYTMVKVKTGENTELTEEEFDTVKEVLE